MDHVTLGSRPSYSVTAVGELLRADSLVVQGWIRSGTLRPAAEQGKSRAARVTHEALVAFVRGNEGLLQRRRQSLLLVDDDPSLTRLYRRIVERSFPDHRFLATGSPFDAVVLALAYRPRLALVDFHLPNVRGDRLCAWLREFPELRQMVILGFTADRVDRDVQEMTAHGADAVVPKPNHNADFIALLREHLVAEHS